MKVFVIAALAVSLTVNVALIWSVVADNDAVAATLTSPAAPRTAERARTVEIEGTIWPAIDSTDYSVQIDRLQARGFPADLISAIVAAQIRERFAERRRAIEASADTAFWKQSRPTAQQRAAIRRLRAEERQTLLDILGHDPATESPVVRARDAWQFSGVPGQKVAALREIVRDFNERRFDLLAESGFAVFDGRQMEALEQEKRTAIRAVLSPEEYLDYELRHSPTAATLRQELSAFNPTEEEFRTIFALREPFDGQFKGMAYELEARREEMRQRAEGLRRINEQIKATLGAERAAAYDRTTDFSYRRTSELVARLELAPETTDQLYALQKDFEQRRRAIFSNREQSFDERAQQLTDLKTEALGKVAPLLRTTYAVEAYTQHGGQWLNMLAPPAPSPK